MLRKRKRANHLMKENYEEIKKSQKLYDINKKDPS